MKKIVYNKATKSFSDNSQVMYQVKDKDEVLFKGTWDECTSYVDENVESLQKDHPGHVIVKL